MLKHDRATDKSFQHYGRFYRIMLKHDRATGKSFQHYGRFYRTVLKTWLALLEAQPKRRT